MEGEHKMVKLAILVWVICSIFLALRAHGPDESPDIFSFLMGGFIGLIPAAIIIGIIYMIRNQIHGPDEEVCPTCNKTRAIMVKEVSQKKQVVVVPTRKVIRHYSQRGEFIGTSESEDEIDEERKVTVVKYLYTCKYCGAKWTEKKRVEDEDDEEDEDAEEEDTE